MRKGLLISIFVIAFLYAAQREIVVTGVKKLRGADVTTISVISSDNIILGTQNAGLHKSTNGGVNFRSLGNPFSNQTLFNNNITAIYRDGVKIYVGGGSKNFVHSPGFHVSTDNGINWNLVGLEGRNINVIIPWNNNILLGTQGLGVQSFKNDVLSPMNNGFGSTNISTLYTDWNDDLFAAAGDGLYKYDEAIELWELFVSGFTPIGFAKGEFNENFVASEDEIFVTANFVDFIPLNPLDIGEDYSFTSIEVSGNYLYATLVPDDFVSDIPQLYVYDLITYEWEVDTDGLPTNPGLAQVIKILGINKYLGTSTGFYKGIVNGPWEDVTKELTGGQITSVSYNPYNNNFYTGGAQGNVDVASGINEDWYENDWGLPLGLQVSDFAHTSSGTFFLLSNAIYFQPNLFDSLEKRNNGLSSIGFRGIAYNPINSVAVVGTFSGLSYSTNLGLQWQSTNFGAYVDEIKFSETLGEFFATTFDKMVRSDGNGQNFETFVGNITPVTFAIKDDVLDWKIGLATFDNFYEIDENGNTTVLGNAGLGDSEFIEYVTWNGSYNTWIGSNDNKIYSFNFSNSMWEQEAELDNYISTVHSFNLSFKNKPNSVENDIILIGTLGGGMYSNVSLTSVDNNEINVIDSYNLGQNFPNPFNPSTTIKYSIPTTSFVTLRIYDVLGNEVATLVNEYKPAGRYEVIFSAVGGYTSGRDAHNLSNGIYFYKLQSGSLVETKKMIILK